MGDFVIFMEEGGGEIKFRVWFDRWDDVVEDIGGDDVDFVEEY